MSNTTSQARGLTFFQALTLVFVVLKLTHNIDWSWWAVLLPLWGPAVVVVGLLLVWAVVAGLATLAYVVVVPKKKRREQAAARRARKSLESYARSFKR